MYSFQAMHLARFFVPTEFLQCLSCRKGGAISEMRLLISGISNAWNPCAPCGFVQSATQLSKGNGDIFHPRTQAAD